MGTASVSRISFGELFIFSCIYIRLPSKPTKRVLFLSYCMYLRKSRKDLELERLQPGSTLARHESILCSLAKSLTISVQSIYREVGSGDTIQDRPVMQQLLTEVEKGLWEGVLVMEIERLARGDSIDQGIVTRTFQYSRTRIITYYKI